MPADGPYLLVYRTFAILLLYSCICQARGREGVHSAAVVDHNSSHWSVFINRLVDSAGTFNTSSILEICPHVPRPGVFTHLIFGDSNKVLFDLLCFRVQCTEIAAPANPVNISGSVLDALACAVPRCAFGEAMHCAAPGLTYRLALRDDDNATPQPGPGGPEGPGQGPSEADPPPTPRPVLLVFDGSYAAEPLIEVKLVGATAATSLTLEAEGTWPDTYDNMTSLETLVWFDTLGNAAEQRENVEFNQLYRDAVVTWNGTQVEVAGLNPFTYYRVSVAVVRNDGFYSVSALDAITQPSILPNTRPGNISIPLRGIKANEILVRALSITPPTGEVHALETELTNMITNVITNNVFFNGFTTGNCIGKGEVSPLFSFIFTNLEANTDYKLRLRIVVDGTSIATIPSMPIPPRLRRATPVFGYPGAEGPVFVSEWSFPETVKTQFGVQPALQVRSERLPESRTRVFWDTPRLFGAPPLRYRLYAVDASGDVVFMDELGINTTTVVVNDTVLVVEYGAERIYITVYTVQGESDESNQVTLFVSVPPPETRTQQDDSISVGTLLAIIIPLTLLLIIAVWFLGRRFRNRTAESITFPPPDKWELDPNKLHASTRIGHGQFGVVYSSMYNGRSVAVKQLKAGVTVSEAKNFVTEAEVMKRITDVQLHPNVLPLVGVTLQALPFQIVTPYASYGSLNHLLETEASRHPQYLDLFQLMLFAMDISQGMQFLASQNIVHRDLAARNVLVCEGWICQISDFGFAREVAINPNLLNMNNHSQNQAPTRGFYHNSGIVVAAVRWMPPEVFTEGRFEELSDVWSYAVLLWELFSFGELPYKEFDNERVIKEVFLGCRLEQPERMPRIMYQLCRSCWERKRPSFATIVAFLYKCFAKFELEYPPAEERVHPDERVLSQPGSQRHSNAFKRISSVSQDDADGNVVAITLDHLDPDSVNESVI